MNEYILKQPTDRQAILTKIHSIILDCDKTVVATIEPMMGKEMMMYKAKGMMKYALSSVKNYMSLHCLPMYGSPAIFNKYKALLTDANFQKGCINFTSAEQMPSQIIKQLFTECSAIDLVKMREEYLQQKKQKAKNKSKR
ncbi:MAG TPA: DUF1801 domain-containing protein [Flavisolibacter sp.]|nr:DUF1801 domain-containing protein [Flavisolibacter sp.]